MKKDIKEKASKLVKAYHEVFDTDAGKLVLHDLMNECNFLSSSFQPNDTPERVLFNEGSRNTVLYILKKLKQDQFSLLKQIEEGEKENGKYDYTEFRSYD